MTLLQKILALGWPKHVMMKALEFFADWLDEQGQYDLAKELRDTRLLIKLGQR